MVALTVRLSNEELEFLRNKAKLEERSINAFIRNKVLTEFKATSQNIA